MPRILRARLVLDFLTAASTAALALAQTAPAMADTGPAAAAPASVKPAAVADLVQQVDLPYDRFTLPNGLTVLVHTDRKAPVVAVSVWYKVGSKNEPKGKTGFAHLFEHLMFYGSQHVPGNFFTPLKSVGATDMNGTTWLDRTNYYETVPTVALDRALMMESDRMGFLLPAMTRQRVDAQRAVVKNEKRQRDNQPYGLIEYETQETLFPAGNPYHHSTIGSMADLDGASLDDVKGWFHDHYGPNNAVLVLAGDIDLATARDKVTHWFGEIPPGPPVQPVTVETPALPAPVSRTIHDAVATPRIYRMWSIPGYDNPDYLPLAIGATVLGGLASSRLDDALVRKSQLAVEVGASADTFAQAGQFVVLADVRPGADAHATGAALDTEIRRMIDEGPTDDELQRAAMTYVSGEIRSLESVGGSEGQAPTLAEGLLYSGDPANFRAELEKAARITPADVRNAMRKWLDRPVYALTVEPGTRTEGGETRGSDSALAPAGPVPPTPQPTAPLSPPADRSSLPPAGTLAALPFPAIERATLPNGIKVYFARRAAVPVVSVRVAFDAGNAADPAGAAGTGALLLRLMHEGTDKLSSTEFARARERLGASINGFATPDVTAFQLDALTPNLSASLALLADYVRHPALAPDELERVRGEQLAAIDAEMRDPDEIALRTLYPVLYGPTHPYGSPPTGSGDAAAVGKLTRADLVRFHDTWFRPDEASVFVVGDTTLPEVVRLLEASFGDWHAPAGPAPTKAFTAPIPVQKARILLIDRPGSPQSVIMAGEVLDAHGTDDLVTLRSANEVLGGSFLARFTTDLRETRGWSYGVGSAVGDRQDRVAFRIQAPVQTDATGPAIAALQTDMQEFLAGKGVTPAELGWSSAGSARELPGMFETSGALLDGIAKIVTYHRPDDYYVRLPERYRALTAAELDTAARAKLDAGKLTWVVVGDAAKVRPQLDKLGLPVEVVKAGN